MALGVRFPEQNLILGAPTPEDAAAGTVYGLPVRRYLDLDGAPNVVSCWELNEAELDLVMQNRRLWLNSWGVTIAPTFITAHAPFGPAGWLKEKAG